MVDVRIRKSKQLVLTAHDSNRSKPLPAIIGHRDQVNSPLCSVNARHTVRSKSLSLRDIEPVKLQPTAADSLSLYYCREGIVEP